ncbi:uncharacterized protein LOC144356515 [Saccoglossus kowalevskii]
MEMELKSHVTIDIGDGPITEFRGHLKRPMGVAVIDNNEILVADSGNARTCVLSEHGEFRSMVMFKALKGTFTPFDVAAGRNGQLLATDQGNNRAYVYMDDGNLVRLFGGDDLHKPCGISLTVDNRVLVVDSDAACVRIYAYNDGRYIKSFGKRGYGPGQFITPQFITTNGRKQIIVSDYRHDSLQVFDNDGNFIKCIKGSGEVWRPMGVTCDREDNIYVCDAFQYKVRKYGATFEPLGSLTAAEGELMGPHGLAVTNEEKQKLVVGDCGNNCVKLFNMDTFTPE